MSVKSALNILSLKAVGKVIEAKKKGLKHGVYNRYAKKLMDVPIIQELLELV